MRKLIVASAFAALMASAPAMAASPGGSIGGGAAGGGGISSPGIAAPGAGGAAGAAGSTGSRNTSTPFTPTGPPVPSTESEINGGANGIGTGATGLGTNPAIAGHIVAGYVLTIKHDSTVKRAGPNALRRIEIARSGHAAAPFCIRPIASLTQRMK